MTTEGPLKWINWTEELASSEEVLRRAKQEAQAWLEAHPDPEPTTKWQAFWEGVGLVLGFYEPPPTTTTTEETVQKAVEMTTRSYMKAVVQVCGDILENRYG